MEVYSASDGLLPFGDVAEKEIQGIPSAQLSTGLYCPLCRGVMRDAVLASKCCFKSFCDKCITDYIVSNSLCVCGGTNVVAPDFLPNNTLRDTIVWFSEMQKNLVSSGDLGNKQKFADMQSRPHQDFSPENYLMPIMSREESKAPKPSMKKKQDLERPSGGNMEVSRHRNSCRKMTGKEDVPSVKSISMSITPPQLSTRDPEFIRTSAKRKLKHDDDNYEEHSHKPLMKVRLHHHQSEFVSATRLPILPDTVDLPPLPSQSSTRKTISDWKHKANVFDRITFPAVKGSSHHRIHSMTSKKYHEDHCNTAATVSKNGYNYYNDHLDYELRDYDRQFKRRPSRYESSPNPALKEGRPSSRGWTGKGFTAASIGGLYVY